MSEFSNTLTGSIKLTRFIDHLVDKKAIASSISVDRQPLKSSRLSIEIDGCTVGTGVVTVDGSTTEVFNFTADDIKIGNKDFTSISSIAVSGISDGFIQIKAVSRTGQPIIQEKSIYDSLPVYFYAISGKIRMQASGQQKVAKYKFMADYDKDVKEKDLIYPISGAAGLTLGQISFVETIFDFDGITHHLEAEVETP